MAYSNYRYSEKLGPPLDNYNEEGCYSVEFTSSEFTRVSDDGNGASGNESVVYISNKDEDGGSYSHVGTADWNRGTEWRISIRDNMGPSSAFRIDRFISFRSVLLPGNFTLFVASGRASNVVSGDTTIKTFFLTSFVIRQGDDKSGRSLRFLTEIFDYPTPTNKETLFNFISGQTSLLNVATSKSDSNQMIPVVFAYRSTNIPFSIAYIKVSVNDSDVYSCGNFDDVQSIYPQNLISKKGTVSSWSDRNILDAIKDNTKSILYTYYDLGTNRLYICSFYVVVSDDRENFSIDYQNKPPLFKEIKIVTFSSNDATPATAAVGSISISENGKVIILNNRVLCLFMDQSSNLFATEVAPPLPFKNFSMLQGTPTVNPFFEYVNPIISNSGKYITVMDVSNVNVCLQGSGEYQIQDFELITLDSKTFEFSIKTSSYSLVDGGPDLYGIPSLFNDSNSGRLFRYKTGFNELTYDPSKDPFDNDMTLKLWFGAEYGGERPDARFGIYNYKNSSIIPNYKSDNGLEGPFISEPNKIKHILKIYSS